MFLFLPLYDDAPRRRVPVVTYGLIGTCAAVFLWQIGLPPRAQDAVAFSYGMIPAVLFGYAHLPARLARVAPWLTVFTSMFLHGGWLHLLGNMLYLWLFGKGVEGALGPFRYLFFYFICGGAAALTQALISPTAEVPMIGASGAIAGVLGAYLVLFPRGNVVVFFWLFIFVRLITVPAVILLGLWFLLQLLSAVSATAGEPGVAFWAHVGGFTLGMLLVPFFRRSGVAMLQPARTGAFVVAPPRAARQRFSAGSVPSAGRGAGRRGPWG
ncbi:MAG TPA: rhomboid family intramembrane serine protease [Stellaceae bacterium]|nr:rhomboid family intramembrane serine protease [Stellaceae bacterium]